MSHYDFARMGWQQFEHLVQALAVAELGNGVRSFGSGADGRREATFSGSVNFPQGGAESTWNGYGVIQVKHRERPTTTSADWQWFISEVRDELNKWVAKKQSDDRATKQPSEDSKPRRTKMPKYFIFATNIYLTGTEGVGGIDTFERLLEEFKSKLDLEGWFAWDAHQLRTLIDGHPNVRRTYLEQIVVGDFIAELEKLLPGQTGVTGQQLAVHAASELARRQWVRIGDAGFGDNSKLRLSEIGVDLPCEYQHHSMDAGGLQETYVGQQIILAANQICRPTQSSGAKGVVVVGGPGQGKSTVAQLIAHAFRIAFIESTESLRLDPVTKESISGLTNRLRERKFPSPQRRRWPIFIDLAKFGRYAAATETATSVLNFVAQEILVSGKAVDSAALLDWIAVWPCVLVLDGLDEVPDARVRAEVIASIGAFINETSSVDADLFVIATTRPQGYRDEFVEILHVETATLSEFTQTQALDYAEALITIRSQEDPDLSARVTERLFDAVHQRMTQRLMTSPLQVTIMTALAERAVDLPTTRHELFDAYYGTIYDRELGKSRDFTELRKYRSHIDFLHEQAGLKLHSRQELPNSSDTLLKRNEVSRILISRLRKVGHDFDDASGIAKRLLELASDRLVLLVSPQKSDYGFEVRSIQEYMAARAITEGTDAQVLAHLRVLLPSAHWRNVWLLAAGRLFQRREHLNDQLLALLEDADEMDDESRVVLPGAALATELYLDGLAIDSPKLRQLVLVRALRQLEDTSPQMSDALSDVIRTSVDNREGYEQVTLGELDRISKKFNSNLASKLLSDNPIHSEAITQQAKRTLVGGHKYAKPETRAGQSRSFVLGTYINAALEKDPVASLREFAEVLTGHRLDDSETLGGRYGTDDDLPTTSLEIFRALEDGTVREALVDTINSIRKREPDVAHYGTSLLRYRFARLVRGEGMQ